MINGRRKTINLYESVFQNFKQPLMICDSTGENCELNNEALLLFSTKSIGNIKEFFPELFLTEDLHSEELKDSWNKKHKLHIQYLSEENRYLISIEENSSEWENFVREQKILNEIYMDLCTCRSEKEIYRKVVENGLERLRFDRVGILLMSLKDKKMLGSWGTNEKGEILDQSNYETDISNDQWALDAIANRDYVQVSYDSNLQNEGQEVGSGWNALSAFFDKDEPVGWIACDNLLTHSPLPKWKKEILGELARMVGRFVSRFRQESNLQELVDIRTEELRISQKNLIEAEKMASLGSLVSGVSHEINTPLGIAITANTYLIDLIEQTYDQLNKGTLKKSQLENMFNRIHESREIITASLNKASEHVINFKKLAAKTSSENYTVFNLRECIESLLKTLLLEHKNLDIHIAMEVDNSLEIKACQSDFIQIFSNLIDNSINHGFKDKERGEIGISVQLTEKNLIIQYRDDGSQIEEETLKKVFDPFYTTSRHLGQAGLGLSIIYNLVYMYKGCIDVQSNNPGLLFKLHFPRLDRYVTGPY